MSLLRAARTTIAAASRRMAPMAAASIAPRRALSGPHASVPQNSGGKTGEFPVAEELSTGREFEELVDGKAGQQRFSRDPLHGPFGTMDAPVKVYSAFASRIVGCMGGGDYHHELLWFELSAGRKHACTRCGQVFVLAKEE